MYMHCYVEDLISIISYSMSTIGPDFLNTCISRWATGFFSLVFASLMQHHTIGLALAFHYRVGFNSVDVKIPKQMTYRVPRLDSVITLEQTIALVTLSKPNDQCEQHYFHSHQIWHYVFLWVFSQYIHTDWYKTCNFIHAKKFFCCWSNCHENQFTVILAFIRASTWSITAAFWPGINKLFSNITRRRSRQPWNIQQNLSVHEI